MMSQKRYIVVGSTTDKSGWDLGPIRIITSLDDIWGVDFRHIDYETRGQWLIIDLVTARTYNRETRGLNI